MARHKHADLMVAFANDSSLVIQCRREGADNARMAWMASPSPNWLEHFEYRIKPPDPVVQVFYGVAHLGPVDQIGRVICIGPANLNTNNNIKLTFTDGKITKAEVL